MMRVECSWCQTDLGWKQGPDGQVSHGICKPCQERELARVRRPFSVRQKALAVLALFGWLLLSGWAGECDRQDAVAAERLRGEIVASAATWAVTR